MIDQLRKTARGAMILQEWLGAGGVPVTQELANARAGVCIDCPMNIKQCPQGGLFELARGFVGNIIKEHLEAKSEMGLSVPDEDALGTCKPCGCINSLAVWCPIKHVTQNTTNDQFQQFPAYCWKRTESGQ